MVAILEERFLTGDIDFSGTQPDKKRSLLRCRRSSGKPSMGPESEKHSFSGEKNSGEGQAPNVHARSELKLCVDGSRLGIRV